MKRAWIFSLAVLAGFVAMLRTASAAPLDTAHSGGCDRVRRLGGADALATPYAQSNLKDVVDNTKIGEYIQQNWESWMEKAGAANPDAAKDIDEGAQNLKKLWHHPLAFYVGPVGLANPKEPTFKLAVLCDAGADAPALADAYKKMIEKNPAPPEAKLSMVVDGNVIILTMGDIKPEAFKAVPGNAGMLPGAPGYVAAMKHVQPPAGEPALAMYVDGKKVIDLIKEAIAKVPDVPAEAKKTVPAVIDALGLNGLGQIAYAGGFDKKEWAEQAFVGTQGPRTGLLALFDGAPVSDAALAMVPKDAAAMSIGHIDLVKVLALTREVVGKVNPDALAAFEGGMAMVGKRFDLDIEKNIINALGDEWISYRGPITDEGTHPFVLVQKLRDAAALAKMFDVLEQQVNTLAEGRVKIEKMDAGTFEVTGVRLPQITIVWTIRDGYLYISNLEGITGAVEQVEKKGESIVMNPGYKAVRAALPAGKALSVTYSEPAKLYPEVYRTLMTLLPMARLLGLDLPADLLPMPKKIAPFLTPGGSVSWVDDEGFHLVGRSAFPGADLISGQASPPSMIAGVPVLTAVLVPSLMRAREQAKTVMDASNMRSIGQLCNIWQAEHDGAFPDDLAEALDLLPADPQSHIKAYSLVKSARSSTTALVMTPELEKMKKDNPAAFAKELDKHSNVVYLGKGLSSKTANANLVLLYQKVGPYLKDRINVLFVDCHVETLRLEDLPKIFKATNESLKDRGLPEVNVDEFRKKAPASKGRQSYFMDESTGEGTIRSASDVPPLKNDKGEATLVEVVAISFDNGKTSHPAYYIKYTPDAQKELQALNELPPATTADEFRQRDQRKEQLIQKGQWIRSPEKDSPWVLAASPEGMAILNHVTDAPPGRVPMRVFPP